MDEFPFSITLEPTPSGGCPQTVLCLRLLRDLGKKRKIFDAVWDQQPVTIKVFTDPIKAKYHTKREWRRLKLLHQRCPNSPVPLFYGRSKQGGWAAVTKKILDAPNLREIWDSTTDKDKKYELLLMICRQLAEQHNKGVLQKDLHLGNFLLQGEKLFTVDVGQMQFFSHKVGRNTAISQLAMLGCSLPTGQTQTFTRLCEEYFQARNWHLEKSDETLFHKKMARHRKTAIRRELRKCLRTSKRYFKIKTSGYTAVLSREFCEGANPRHLVEQIDELMAHGQVIKNSNTSYVARMNWNGKEVVVKRYNYKGFFHSLRHTIKGSRALHNWLNSHKLRKLNIPTPKPLAYISTYKRLLLEKAYIVTEYIPGKTFHRLIKREKKSCEEQIKITNQILNIIERLGEYRISHGDLKDTNILVTDEGPVLTDLDSVKTHIFDLTGKWQTAKDVAHLKRSLSELENYLQEKQ